MSDSICEHRKGRVFQLALLLFINPNLAEPYSNTSTQYEGNTVRRGKRPAPGRRGPSVPWMAAFASFRSDRVLCEGSIQQRVRLQQKWRVFKLAIFFVFISLHYSIRRSASPVSHQNRWLGSDPARTLSASLSDGYENSVRSLPRAPCSLCL